MTMVIKIIEFETLHKFISLHMKLISDTHVTKFNTRVRKHW